MTRTVKSVNLLKANVFSLRNWERMAIHLKAHRLGGKTHDGVGSGPLNKDKSARVGCSGIPIKLST